MTREQIKNEFREIEEKIRQVYITHLESLYSRKEQLQDLCPHEKFHDVVIGDCDYCECEDCGKFYY